MWSTFSFLSLDDDDSDDACDDEKNKTVSIKKALSLLR